MRVVILIFAGLAANTIGRWLPKTLECDLLYFKLDALSILLWLLAGFFSTTNKVIRWAWAGVSLLAVLNFFDEIWTNKPQCVDNIEVVAGFLIVVTTIALIRYEYKKCGNTYNY